MANFVIAAQIIGIIVILVALRLLVSGAVPGSMYSWGISWAAR